jgi:hypothetical protein
MGGLNERTDGRAGGWADKQVIQTDRQTDTDFDKLCVPHLIQMETCATQHTVYCFTALPTWRRNKTKVKVSPPMKMSARVCARACVRAFIH